MKDLFSFFFLYVLFVSQPRLIQAMQGREVDEAIMQERERDIKQINEDLVLVKEMFKGKENVNFIISSSINLATTNTLRWNVSSLCGLADMAELVDSQASAITEIADKTEASHERAKAGLTQVQQAAGHQPGCNIC